MQASHYKLGYWTSLIGIVLTLFYLGAIAGMFVSGAIPPTEPFISIISVVSLVSVPMFIFLWVILHNAASVGKKIFTQTSLAMIVIFATLTSINRYVALTVVRQSMDMGIMDGLNWFMPYGWPSIMAAMEVLAWGFFLGLAFISLAPVFQDGKLELSIFWTLIISGIFCLIAVFGQIMNSVVLNMLGIIAWGPGLVVLFTLFSFWFKNLEQIQIEEI
ncbi:MAG TPA: hypothetical protein VFI68_01365 [Anaerolineales bacterium]|nr:hypothetical protein [Anaerolineales bacterium]